LTDSNNNPLLELSSLPHHAPRFDLYKTEHFLPAVKQAIEEARANIDAIKNSADEPSFENTIVALETAAETLGEVTSVYYNGLSAMGGDDLHALIEEIGPITAQFSNDISLDPDLFARVKAVYDKRDELSLTAEEATLLEDSYKSFVRSGALLDEDKKTRLREISEKLSTLGPTFMNNVSKSSEAFELVIDNENDLSGLPESALSSAQHAAEERNYKDKWLFTLDYPSYIPFMQYADNRELRETMWRAFSNRAHGDDFDNQDNILAITRLRHEKAQLLGFDTHAGYVLDERMAKKPEEVWSFLDKLKATYKPAAEQDLQQIKDFAHECGLAGEIKPWDIAYYSEKLKEKLFEFSSEELRPYFPLENVLTGCFTHFEKLFGLRFKPSDAYPVWHKDVKAFEVYDARNDEFVGLFYGDFFPRKGKKSGAWMTAYRAQGLYRGALECPVIAIVCNFTKPTGDKPSLLTFDEVTTLFHEMGHATHGLLSKVTYRSLSGTSVLWDFVELPSQLQENWCYEKDTLDMFAAHYETGEKIPPELIDKLRAARNFMVGYGGLRQIALGTLDMSWHDRDPAGIDDVAAYEDKSIKDVTLFERLGGPVSTSFNHIFAGGYSAGYYSYKWAEVLDADTFELFLEKGLYDKNAAESLKEEILSKGGSEQPDILYKRFRGREADPEALLRREGLLDNKEAA